MGIEEIRPIAARRSASQPMKARASTTTMKILRKVSITLLAID
jgi:hypothetical protein